MLKWFNSLRSGGSNTNNQLISLGTVDASDRLGQSLHEAAVNGNKDALKNVLEKGIFVDFPNNEGQTPLFCACYAGMDKTVEYLLSVGAQANERSNTGMTPVHAACYAGKVHILMALLQYGGDLRLHDCSGRTVKDWAILQPKPNKRVKMLEFLDKCRLFAMSHDGQDLLMGKASSSKLHEAQRKNSVKDLIRAKIGRDSVHSNLEHMATSQHTIGFGQVYSTGADKAGFLSAVQIVSENSLRHDPNGETYSNGAFATMESMFWNYTPVTVKKMREDLDSYQGGVVDLFITELEYIGRLRHPNILLLMGVCQNTHLDGLVLIYENVKQGSLYSYLYDKMEKMQSQTIYTIARQMCDAIIFIHLRGFVHCAITSHAISVVDKYTFKLGNFENMVESSSCEYSKKNSVVHNTRENAVFNWMAPEMILTGQASFYCDMYSYCAVLWEIYHGEVPWSSSCAEAIKSHYAKEEPLKIVHGKIPDYFQVILDYGLKIDMHKRKLSFLHIQDLLFSQPKDAKKFLQAHFRHLFQPDVEPQSPSSNSSTTEPSRYTGTPKSSAPANPVPKPRKGQSAQPKDNKTDAACTNGNNLSSTTCTSVWANLDSSDDERMPTIKRLHGNSMRQKKKYHTNGLDWEMSQQEGDDVYQYRIRMKKSPPSKLRSYSSFTRRDVCPQVTYDVDRPAGFGIMSRPTYENECDVLSKPTYEVSHFGDTRNKASETTDSRVYADRSEKNRKSSSLLGFSYLDLKKDKKAKSLRSKPACHHTSRIIDEEFSTAGKLTTAGSLYALYNDHSPDRPRGQLPHRKSSSTLPKQRYSQSREPVIPLISPDKDWFGGRASVRDLALIFQEQIAEHEYNQGVLDGMLSSGNLQGLSEDKMQQADGHVKYESTRSAITGPDVVDSITESTAESASSKANYAETGIESTSQSQCIANYDTTDSVDSEELDLWVDKEISKIKKNLSKEMVKIKSEVGQSPDLIKASPPAFYMSSSTSTTEGTDGPDCVVTSSASKDSRDFQTTGEYYYDEMYEKPKSMATEKTGILKERDSLFIEPVLPMETVLKSKSPQGPEEIGKSARQNHRSRSSSRIPLSTGKLATKAKSSEGTYANIVTVRTSLDDLGTHEVTHKMKNLKTGGTKTLLNDIVNARKVVATFDTDES